MYTQFALKVQLDNDAFVPLPHPELVRILGIVKDRLERRDVEGFIYDTNGYKVGAWSIEDDKQPTGPGIQKYL